MSSYEVNSMSELESIDVLNNGTVGHLGCVNHGVVYVVPITFAYKDNYVYCHSLKGKKVSMIFENPEVCFQVEEIENRFKWKSVIVWGHVEILEGADSERGKQILLDKMNQDKFRDFYRSRRLELGAMLEESVIYRIKIKNLTGKFEGYI